MHKPACLHKETKTNKLAEPSPLHCILGWKSGQIALLVKIMCIWPFNAGPILFLEIIKWQHVACSSVPAQADCLDGSSKTYSIRTLRNKQLQLLIYIWTEPITEGNSFSCFFSLWLGFEPIESLSCGYCSGTLQLNRWTLSYITHLGIIWQNNPVKYLCMNHRIMHCQADWWRRQ